MPILETDLSAETQGTSWYQIRQSERPGGKKVEVSIRTINTDAAILADVLMPTMDGFALCQEVRRDPRLAAVPIVLVSAAYVEGQDRELAGRVGANALVLRTPDLAEAAYPSSYFDQVLIWHVLEHLQQPRETLEEVRRILRPGGRLVVAVPNLASRQAVWSGAAWFHLDLPRHLHHFPLAALRRLLDETGFEPISDHHFSVRQNPFGWVQSALNRVTWLPRNGLYTLLHNRQRTRPAPFDLRTRAILLGAFGLLVPWGIAASVVSTQSMVAMFGLIMPAPLAMPPMRKAPDSVSTAKETSFGNVSLVMMAWAHFNPARRDKRMVATPVSIRLIGSGMPIRPVEQTKNCSKVSPTRAAAAAAMARASARPCGPVQALAFPLLRITARIFPNLRCSMETWTGAALTRLVVKVAADVHGVCEISSAVSSRLSSGSLMPQATLPQKKPPAAQTPPRVARIIGVPRPRGIPP